MPNAQLQRDARDNERSLRLRKFQRTVWIGACRFFIVLGLVISLLNAYNMGYGDAKSQTSLTQQESQRFRFLKRSSAVGIGVGAMVIFTGIVLLSRYGTMKDIAVLFLLGLVATPAAAQSNLCWRDPYPWIPGEWAGSGLVIEAGNRFQTVTRATVELWATAYKR